MIYDLFIRKINIYLNNDNWLKLNFDNGEYLKISFLAFDNKIVFYYRQKEVQQFKCRIFSNLEINILSGKNKLNFSLLKKQFTIDTQKKIKSITKSFWIKIDAYDNDSLPIIVKQDNLKNVEKNLNIGNKHVFDTKEIKKDKCQKLIDNQFTKENKITNKHKIPRLKINPNNILLSFCITCFNRFTQIRQTLFKNLKDNIDLHLVSEFVLVDFGTPYLEDFVNKNFKLELDFGYLRYIKSKQLKYWHASIAKNISHKHAKGMIVTNLDGDNFIGEHGGKHILKNFQSKGSNLLFHQWSGKSGDGTYGRISCSKKNFFYLGGYDESFLPMGYQDHDFILRYSMCFGAENYLSYTEHNPNLKKQYANAIKNDKIDSLVNTRYNGRLKWKQMNEINKNKSKNNIVRGIFKVN